MSETSPSPKPSFGEPGFVIDEIYAFIAVDPKDGDEGIIAMSSNLKGQAVDHPLIGADKNRIEAYRPFVAMLAASSPDLEIKLVKFSNREEVEVIQADPDQRQILERERRRQAEASEPEGIVH